MSKVDWENAPDWADRAVRYNTQKEWMFANNDEFIETNDGRVRFGSSTREAGVSYLDLRNFSIDAATMTMRPDEWKKGAERMEPIVQNGNDGEHYAELDNVNHPSHYQSDDGIECIDAIRAALGREGFIAHCRGTAIKYAWRSGKKSAHAEDLRKAAWYLERAAIELEKERCE